MNTVDDDNDEGKKPHKKLVFYSSFFLINHTIYIPLNYIPNNHYTRSYPQALETVL